MAELQRKQFVLRSSGGLALIFKSNYDDWILVEKESPNFLWFKITKEYTKTEKDIYVCGTYIPPQNSIYFCPELFEELENVIEKFSAFGSILLMGDFNSRTGKYSDNSQWWQIPKYTVVGHEIHQ